MSEPKPVFCDYNSTTPLDADVAQAITERQREVWGNPSSVHAAGRLARAVLEEARDRVAAQIGCDSGELYFTSGGTESDNLALKGAYFANPRRSRRLVVSAIEHPAVTEAAEDLMAFGADVVKAPSDARGIITPTALETAIGEGALIASVMAANNETGIVQPVADLAAAAHARGAWFHTDAVQAVGKIPVDLHGWGVDAAALTAHKFYGPRGIGALFIRRGIGVTRQISGGSHERKRRAGTENVIGAWGMALALEKASAVMEAEEQRLRGLTERLIAELCRRIPNTHVHGDPEHRLANTVSLSFAGVEGEAIVVSLDLLGICIASGSACSSGATEPSHVILALGIDPALAAGAVRISLGRSSTTDHVDRLIAELPSVVERLRSLSPSFAESAR